MKVAWTVVKSVVSMVDLMVVPKAEDSAGRLEIAKGKTSVERMVEWSAAMTAGMTAAHLVEHSAALLDVNLAEPTVGH